VTTVPAPAMGTICGLAPPSSKKVSLALSGPIIEGRNFIVTLQVVLPAKLLPLSEDEPRKEVNHRE